MLPDRLQRHAFRALLCLGVVLVSAPAVAHAELALHHRPVSESQPNKAIYFDFAVTPASEWQGGDVHWRPITPTVTTPAAWQKAPIRLSSTGVYRATVPAEAVDDPGLEYYVVSLDVGGRSGPQFASAAAPHPVFVRGTSDRVDDQALLLELGGRRSQARLYGAWIDYRTFGTTARTPQDLGPRYSDLQIAYRFWMLRGVEYLEVGVGRLVGFAERSDLAKGTGQGISVGFKRGWAEVATRLTTDIGIAGRVVLGVDEDNFLIGGAAVLRLGKPRRTRLLLELGATAGVGFHFLAGFHINTLPRWPMALEVEVTDEPNVGENAGEIARFRLSRELTDGALLGAVVSYQALGGEDHGLGGGGELEFRF